MTSISTLLIDLETSIATADPTRHVRCLKDLTGLFLASADRLADEHVDVYDAVMQRLLAVVETEQRARFARIMAPVPKAPPRTIATLARDHISVAAPVLAQSSRLGDADLAVIAASSSQEHLLAITSRRSLPSTVTDILVERGNKLVLRAAAQNPGARFSDEGFERMVEKSTDDPSLQQIVGLRADLPPKQFRVLVEKAAREVKEKLITEAKGEKLAALDKIVVAAVRTLDEQALEMKRDYAAALAAIERVAQCGKLNEQTVATLARSGKFEEVTCALSHLTRLPIDAVENALIGERAGGLVLVARALNFTWTTVRALLKLRKRGLPSQGDLEGLMREFQEMSPSTARRALGFMVTRDVRRQQMAA